MVCPVVVRVAEDGEISTRVATGVGGGGGGGVGSGARGLVVLSLPQVVSGINARNNSMAMARRERSCMYIQPASSFNGKRDLKQGQASVNHAVLRWYLLMLHHFNA